METKFRSRALNVIGIYSVGSGVTFEDGVKYSDKEIMISRGADAKTVKALHDIKKVFDGAEIVGYDQGPVNHIARERAIPIVFPAFVPGAKNVNRN
jgi:hypothetical protein